MSQELVEAAQAARELAYAPYSDFAVGAAVQACSGSVYSGCNVENASYGLTVCAERVALFKAVAAGEREICDIIVMNGRGHERHFTLDQLLPANFSGQDLGLRMASARRAGGFSQEGA